MNNAKWTWFAIGYQCVFAYIVSFVIYQIGSFFTGSGNLLGGVIALLLTALIVFLLVRPAKRQDRLTVKVRT